MTKVKATRKDSAKTGMRFHRETATRPGVKQSYVEGWYPLKNDAGELLGFSIIVQDEDRK